MCKMKKIFTIWFLVFALVFSYNSGLAYVSAQEDEYSDEGFDFDGDDADDVDSSYDLDTDDADSTDDADFTDDADSLDDADSTDDADFTDDEYSDDEYSDDEYSDDEYSDDEDYDDEDDENELISFDEDEIIVAAGNVGYVDLYTELEDNEITVTSEKETHVSGTVTDSTLVVSVSKYASKGKSYILTLSANDEEFDIIVTVRNAAKSVKAKTKKVTLKKGKKKKLVFKVKAEDSGAALTSSVNVKASNKKVKIVKINKSSSKIVVVVKAIKPGKSSKITVSINGKKASTKVKIKKDKKAKKSKKSKKSKKRK